MTMLSTDPHCPEEGVLLRELHHRIDKGIASAIDLVSAAVVRADAAEAKAALGDVVELLHGHAQLHQALVRPEGEALHDAATYIRKLGCAMRKSLLDRMGIRLAFATESIPLQSERCWRLGLIVHELIVNAARHAYFDARAGEIKVKLSRIDTVVSCVVLDNGSRLAQAVGGEHQFGGDLARGLGGRIAQGFAAEFTSIVVSFHLSERERRANGSMATRRTKSPRPLRARPSTTPGSGPPDQSERASMQTDPNLSRAHPSVLAPARSGSDVLGGLLSPSHRSDSL